MSNDSIMIKNVHLKKNYIPFFLFGWCGGGGPCKTFWRSLFPRKLLCIQHVITDLFGFFCCLPTNHPRFYGCFVLIIIIHLHKTVVMCIKMFWTSLLINKKNIDSWFISKAVMCVQHNFIVSVSMENIQVYPKGICSWSNTNISILIWIITTL